MRSKPQLISVFCSTALFLSACGNPTSTPAPAPSAQPTLTPSPAPTATATQAATPTDSPSPTATATAISLPQQWTGIYSGTDYGTQKVGLIIEEAAGATFAGKMSWSPTQRYRGALTVMQGEFVNDFEQDITRWLRHEDFASGDKSGTWLKWTETALLTNVPYTLNGWYYGHIREDGHLVAIYYFNSTDRLPANGIFDLTLTK